MRGNAVRKQVFIYSGVALAIAAALTSWYVFSPGRAHRIFGDEQRINILLTGRDQDALELMCLLSLTREDAILFSLPIDLRVRDASGSFVRASDLHAQGGASAEASSVGRLLGLEIPYYISGDRQLFLDWVDELGGLTVSLSATAKYIDATAEPPILTEIQPGEHALDGREAIGFVVSSSEAGDLGVLNRQQAMLKAFISQAIMAGTKAAVRERLREVFPQVETNLRQRDLDEVAQALAAIPAESLRTDHLTGALVDIDGVTYTQPNVVETERVVASLLKGLSLLTPNDVRVAVFNGNGVRLMARRTADYLIARGFQVTGIANADAFDYRTSYVIVLTDEAKAWVLRDALPSTPQIVFPATFAAHYDALKSYIPAGTDIVLIAGEGLEIE